MSKDSFKVKNGLTLTPIDPSEIVNPQAGDLIADSTDDNKIKRYDATSADWSSVGGSGSGGVNAVISALDIDWSSADVFYKDVSANTTFTFSNVQDGKTIIVIVNNTAVGTVTVDFPTALKASGFSGDIDASNESVFTFVASNSKVYATSVANMV